MAICTGFPIISLTPALRWRWRSMPVDDRSVGSVWWSLLEVWRWRRPWRSLLVLGRWRSVSYRERDVLRVRVNRRRRRSLVVLVDGLQRHLVGVIFPLFETTSTAAADAAATSIVRTDGLDHLDLVVRDRDL